MSARRAQHIVVRLRVVKYLAIDMPGNTGSGHQRSRSVMMGCRARQPFLPGPIMPGGIGVLSSQERSGGDSLQHDIAITGIDMTYSELIKARTLISV
ncbi:hypothetical protein D3W54_13360 [Komagataeibacter medellinensis]|uniref:Uncharacterized protein n=1 Tax=Komagataeibacter medellinensis TaxID=1177712 RepID=A0ABQ6VZH2_9PROT|nr:hypothetical protein D3W54_13360 [Komagataeibacter medellinensis]